MKTKPIPFSKNSINRRAFLRSGVAATAAATTSLLAQGEEVPPAITKGVQSSTPGASSIEGDRSSVQEAPRKTPVVADVDVLVVGGGPAGIGAALAAATEGAKTLLVERQGMLGGVWTSGLLNPLFEAYSGRISSMVLNRLKERNGWNGDAFVTETMKYVLEEVFAENNVEFWYHVMAVDAIVVDNRVRGILVEGKSGREAILAKVIIDCSGDGDIAARAGVPFVFGRESDGIAQPMTLMCEVTGSNLEGRRTRPLRELRAAVEELNLPPLPYGDKPFGTPYLINAAEEGVAALQATHVYRYDATNTRDLTHATVEARKQVHEIFMPAFKGTEKWKDMRLAQTASAIGVREARHMEGIYRITDEDAQTGARFEDAIAKSGFPCDVHELFPNDPNKPKNLGKINTFEIPYRSLVPKTVKGLLFGGRLISGSHVAHASYRVTGTCMGIGQAAGLAAAIAASRNTTPDQVDGVALHENLRKWGVKFLE